MNKMPEVAEMLGVEIGEKFKIKEVGSDRSYMSAFHFEESGLYQEGRGRESVDVLHNLLSGVDEIVKLPRYTIPSDLEVDAKVWVRDGNKEQWNPRHFADLLNGDNLIYGCYERGHTSFTTGIDGKSHKKAWNFCITDEDYRKRKEGE
jgi:hypothetical protein